jgi:hypothetical protein|nr:MAG TPA: hypothetical protein [Caudoviricetes sp.]
MSKQRIEIAMQVAEQIVTMSGDTLNGPEKEDLFNDVFDSFRSLLGRFTSDVIEEMHSNLPILKDFIETIKE